MELPFVGDSGCFSTEWRRCEAEEERGTMVLVRHLRPQDHKLGIFRVSSFTSNFLWLNNTHFVSRAQRLLYGRNSEGDMIFSSPFLNREILIHLNSQSQASIKNGGGAKRWQGLLRYATKDSLQTPLGLWGNSEYYFRTSLGLKRWQS
jgi:hypothetical protein